MEKVIKQLADDVQNKGLETALIDYFEEVKKVIPGQTFPAGRSSEQIVKEICLAVQTYRTKREEKVTPEAVNEHIKSLFNERGEEEARKLLIALKWLSAASRWMNQSGVHTASQTDINATQDMITSTLKQIYDKIEKEVSQRALSEQIDEYLANLSPIDMALLFGYGADENINNIDSNSDFLQIALQQVNDVSVIISAAVAYGETIQGKIEGSDPDIAPGILALHIAKNADTVYIGQKRDRGEISDAEFEQELSRIARAFICAVATVFGWGLCLYGAKLVFMMGMGITLMSGLCVYPYVYPVACILWGLTALGVAACGYEVSKFIQKYLTEFALFMKHRMFGDWPAPPSSEGSEESLENEETTSTEVKHPNVIEQTY